MRNYSSILLLGIVLFGSATSHAQYRNKLGIPLDAYLEHRAVPGEHIDLFIHGPREAVGAAVRAHGGTVKMDRPGLVSARVPAGQVRQLASDPAISFFEFGIDPGFTLNDSMRVKNNIVPVHLGETPLIEGYDGQDVIMGIIDSGVDVDHLDFRNTDGTTRVLKYWDQNLPINGQTPQPYNYGQVWDSGQIDAGLITSVDGSGHGSTVAGTAAGNGSANGLHRGIAYKADMMVVSLQFSGNFRAKVADAVKYIIDEATALGRPVVVNASVGSMLGSHDGLDAAALLIDDVLQAAPGRVMVCGAGNTNLFAPYHVTTEVASTADTLFTWYRYNANSALGYGAVFFEVWADSADFHNVQYAVGVDRVQPFAFRGRTSFHNVLDNLGQVITEPVISANGNVLGVVDFLAFQRGGQYLLQIHIPEPDSTTYRFRFITTGQGKHDAWSGINFGTSMIQAQVPIVATYPPMANYVHPDRNQHMADSWACSPHVVTVANYINELAYINYWGVEQSGPGIEGDIAPESSLGPSRTGLMKPDIAATGSTTISSYPLPLLNDLLTSMDERLPAGGMHMRNGGTSMASPVVAGAAALYLQKCPQATHVEIRDALHATALSDSFTTATPNTLWGFGKLDAFATLLHSGTTIAVDAPEEICEDSEIILQAEGGMSEYLWSTGAVTSGITYSGLGPVDVVAVNPSGCVLRSDTLTFDLLSAPQPAVSAVGAVLTSSPAASYQWYLLDQAIGGATDQMWEALTSGVYSVEVTYANGCVAQSEAVQVIVTGIDETDLAAFAVWPSPARDVLMVSVPTFEGSSAMLNIQDARGRVVMEQGIGSRTLIEIPLQGLAPGTYTVVLQGEDTRMQQRFVKVQ